MRVGAPCAPLPCDGSVDLVVLPSGTVTLMFTDIEGSTRAWEAHPAEMRVALARHDVLVRDAIERAGGSVFKTVGDAFCAVFGDCRGAVAAASHAQRALADESWPETTPIWVRMALHTGECDERDGDFFGPTVNRVARLLAIGWGGQTLVSGATAQLVHGPLPNAMSLRDLGEHRLKDLGRPEHVFQLDVDGLESSFPALRSLDNPQLHHNLPVQVTSFVGRSHELSEVRDRVGAARLVTLTGPGGTGKTRLALQAAADELDGSGDGVWFVELAPLTSGELVASEVASVLGIREQPGRSTDELLVDALRDRRLLMVLDNCEHVIDEAAKLADLLLRSCRDVALLATSREPLAIDGEVVVRVAPLGLPTTDADVSAVEECEAVRLFVDRVRLHRRDFALDASTAPTVARLCRRLDGIPLAIELAAVRLRSLTIEELESKLDQRFALLTGGARTAHERHQTLRATIAWSYDLLTPTEQRLFARVGVFAGGFDLDAAAAVAAAPGMETYDVIDVLGGLVDKSLLVRDDIGTISRYTMLETLRAYATERLVDLGDEPDTRNRHLTWATVLAETASSVTNTNDPRWLDQLDRERDNLRVALAWAFATDANRGAYLVSLLHRFWDLRAHFRDAEQWLAAAIALPDLEPAMRASLLRGLGNLAHNTGRFTDAVAFHEESAALARDCGSRALLCMALNNLGLIRMMFGDFDTGRAIFVEARETARGLEIEGDLVASESQLLAEAAWEQGDFDAAARLLEDADHFWSERSDTYHSLHARYCHGVFASKQGDIDGAWTTLTDIRPSVEGLGEPDLYGTLFAALAELAIAREQLNEARELIRHGLSRCAQWSAPVPTSRLLYVSALLDRRLGDLDNGLQHACEALELEHSFGLKLRIAETLELIAGLSLDRGDPLAAANLRGAADALRKRLGAPILPDRRTWCDADLDALRNALPEEALNDAWTRAQALDNHDVVAVVLHTHRAEPTR